MRRFHIVTSALLIAIALLFSTYAFAEPERVNSLKIRLITPQKSNSPQRILGVSNEPVIVSGEVPVSISRKPRLEDAEANRYLVEYFIDGQLVYQTNGVVEGKDKATFDWILDTTKYKNGKHKLVVNYWDSEDPSAIGIKHFIVKNKISLEDLQR